MGRISTSLLGCRTQRAQLLERSFDVSAEIVYHVMSMWIKASGGCDSFVPRTDSVE
jgi:hypothetical protein